MTLNQPLRMRNLDWSHLAHVLDNTVDDDGDDVKPSDVGASDPGIVFQSSLFKIESLGLLLHPGFAKYILYFQHPLYERIPVISV